VKSSVSRAFSVGVVSAVSLVIIGVGIFLVGNQQRIWEGRADYGLQFSRTNGLSEGAPVMLDGVNVGGVSSMRFPPDPTARFVEVRISVVEDVMPRIRRDTIGRIQTLGLLGDKYIELTSGSLQAEALTEGELIRSVDPVDYEALIGQSGDIVTNVIEVTGLLKDVLRDIDDGKGLIGRLVSDRDYGRQLAEELRSVITNLESATGRIDHTLERVERGEGALGTLLAADSTLDETLVNLDTASRNVLDFSDKLVHGDGALARLASDDEFADRTLGNLQRASSSIADVADQIRAGRGTLGKLVYDEGLYDDAQSLVGGSGGLWGMLWRFIWPFSRSETPQPAADPVLPPVEAAASGANPEAPLEPTRTRDLRPQDRFSR
jgi:phospholipid/cholesterol/gamma-HCH transport system substrate-binding protein